jgi:signal transduction histidine kinase/ActR/RegA family two-component response regulator
MQYEDRWFDVIADPLLDNTGAVMGAVQILYDITDSKRMETELIKTQKLESIGVLAGGIAHDFNNILTGIMGNISLAMLDEDLKNTVAARLAEAEKSCVRAKYLTQQLITFASGGAPIKRVTPVASLVHDAVSLALSGSAVKSEFADLDDWCMAKIDEGQIRQVIHNIVANAVDAMPAGGTVTVSCVCVAPGSDERIPASMGPAVKISVIDEGTGISKADLPRIFDPFFTLKQKRSGLGLATSYSIVRNHGGIIAAESQPGLGAVFHLYLPAVEGGQSDPKVAAQAGATAKILVMDDEKMVRDVAGQMLKHMGHDVSFAEDGIDAIRLYWEAKDQGRSFDIVVLDMTIPGGPGGKETIAKLRAIDPEVKAIVSSGYANDPVLSNFREYGFSAVVVKPYKFDELRNAVQALLPAFR